MSTPKYFYVVTMFPLDNWCSGNKLSHCGEDPKEFIHYIGEESWPLTRDKARKAKRKFFCENIFQFENKPPYKFIKQVS